MKRTSLFFSTLLFAILLAVSSACGKSATPMAPTQPPAIATMAPTQPPAAATATLVTLPAVTLDDEIEMPDQGFAFRPVPGYKLDTSNGVEMLAEGADPDTGPAIFLTGGVAAPGTTAQSLIDLITNSELTVSASKPVTVDGVEGLSVEILRNADNLTGRFITVMVTPEQQFIIGGMAPQKAWEAEISEQFEAVLGAVRFIDLEVPVDPTPEPVSQVELTEIRQWAVSAAASSEYDNSDWSASQATGEPDTLECGDLPTAWASAESTGLDWLELQYQIPVNPKQINVIETHMPNQVTKIELIDTSYQYHTVYTGQPAVLDCPYSLSVDVDGADYKAIGIKLTIDQTILDPTSWNEIDAVELVGRGTDEEAGGGEVVQPTATAAALDSGPQAGDYTLPDLDPASLTAGTFYFTIAGAGEDATIDKGVLQDQSTTEEYVVGFVSQDFRDAVSLFLPHDLNTGFLPLKPYDGTSFTKGPSAAIYIGSGYYYADGGLVNIEAVSSDSVTGSFVFEATYESDPARKVSVAGIFNEIPLVIK